MPHRNPLQFGLSRLDDRLYIAFLVMTRQKDTEPGSSVIRRTARCTEQLRERDRALGDGLRPAPGVLCRSRFGRFRPVLLHSSILIQAADRLLKARTLVSLSFMIAGESFGNL